MKTLNQIGEETGTDKFSLHDYLRTYDDLFAHLRHQPIRFLEMGVLQGQSILMWSRYFDHPDARIVGIDIHTEWCQPISDPRVSIIQTSYTNPDFFASNGMWHAAVEDGPHLAMSQQESFGLSWPTIKPGGILAIEDLHTVHCPELCDAPLNTIQYFARIAERMQDPRGAQGSARYNPEHPHSEIESIEFRKGLIILRKRA